MMQQPKAERMEEAAEELIEIGVGPDGMTVKVEDPTYLEVAVAVAVTLALVGVWYAIMRGHRKWRR